ncbi:uncharacterized protein LOC122078161 isoform X2 [Macadamia integrifolia]|uniref:uncharacterized protein LOC122078161 isoform X2 n=1 Tax=Macadamia integrifolia TaxID=60698 RepID=UPI001C4E98EC|nr:uncharacterized protein LOC122078161 isoform X2 [Macadamia integrifolia]
MQSYSLSLPPSLYGFICLELLKPLNSDASQVINSQTPRSSSPCSLSLELLTISLMATMVYVVLLLALSSVMDEASKCGNGCPCMLAESAPAKNEIRKLFLHGADEVFKGFGSSSSLDSQYGKDMLGRGLREVPSGPDPLHHNGGSPKKPHTP